MERHWEDSAASLTTRMTLHACYTAAAEDRVRFVSLILLVSLHAQASSSAKTLNEMISYQHDADYRHGWRTPGLDSRPLRTPLRLGKGSGDAR